MKHFVTLNNNIGVFKIILISLLMIPTIGAPFWLMYEYFFEPKYWKNRWRLRRYINQGRVKVEEIKSTYLNSNNINIYILKIDDVEYSLWIWDDCAITVGEIGVPLSDYIGLFVGSLITKRLNKSAIRDLKILGNENK